MAIDYLRSSISNGNVREQALIRRWWHEQHAARGMIVWEYRLDGLYADAIWFPGVPGSGSEEPGRKTASRFPLAGREIVLCEAKVELNPELIGQALVYNWYASQAGAVVRDVFIFVESDPYERRHAARALGLKVVVAE